MPDVSLSEDPGLADRLAATTGTLLGDLPAMATGAALAGGPASPVTAMGGAFALPAALRHVLVEQYENGKIQSAGRFVEVAGGALLAEFKGFVTGAATGGAGLAAKAIGAPAVGSLAAEVATMTTVGAALEGEIPQPHDFLDAAIVLGGIKGAVGLSQKLNRTYANTGKSPIEVTRDAEVEPTIREDLASSNIETPRVYREVEAAEAAKSPVVESEAARADAALSKAVEKSREAIEPEVLEPLPAGG
jgi:hypothetical protein